MKANPLLRIMACWLACAVFGFASAVTAVPVSVFLFVVMAVFGVLSFITIMEFRDDY